MRHESKLSTWIRSGGQSAFVLKMNNLVDLETKFSVVPDRLLDSIIDDALVVAVGRLNQYLPSGVSIDISAVDLTPIRDQLRGEVAARLTEIGVTVNPDDPAISAIIARYSEVLNRVFQTKGLQLESNVWRSRDDPRVRSAHAEYDDQTFSWSDPPSGGHPGQGWNCRCTAEPIIDLESIPEGGVCDILTGDRLASVFPDADADRLAQIARESTCKSLLLASTAPIVLLTSSVRCSKRWDRDCVLLRALTTGPTDLAQSSAISGATLTRPSCSEEPPTILRIRKLPQTAPTPIGTGMVVSKAATGGGFEVVG